MRAIKLLGSNTMDISVLGGTYRSPALFTKANAVP
jgi:hypothetical protein